MKIISVAVVAGLTLAAAASSARGQASYKKDIPDSLAKRAKIGEAAAATTAQTRVPKAKIDAVELEVENGKLMYSYDMKTAGKSGIDEVNVDAVSGQIIGFAHETPATEKKEAADEAKATKASKPKKP